MPTIDWGSFLREHAVECWTSGKNTAVGCITIRCPWCGNSDPSHHLGINLETGVYGCWRDHTHRGRNPIRLVAQLLGIDYDTARQELQPYTEGSLYRARTRIDELIEWYEDMSIATPQETILPLEVPRGFVQIQWSSYFAQYCSYLMQRGFENHEIDELCASYQLMAGADNFSNRIIFPVYSLGRLMTWTGRSIDGRHPLRYKTLTCKDKDPHGRRALGPITDFLLWQDSLFSGGHALILTEGPFDSLWVDFYVRQHGIRATCIFGLRISEAQKDLLHILKPRYERFYLMLDSAETLKALKLQADLEPLKVQLLQLPEDVKDPGDLTKQQLFGVLSDQLT